MIEEIANSTASGVAPAATQTEAAAPAPAASHPAVGILAEIETVLRDLDAIPSHIAAWVKAKLAEAKATL
jgi:hypothetical protein